MISHIRYGSQTLSAISWCVTRWGCVSPLLAWCPLGRAQASAQAPASAEEVRQLREVVQGLVTRVAELESELKQRQPSSRREWRESCVGFDCSSCAASAAASATVTSAATTARHRVFLGCSKEQIIAGDRAILDYLHDATLNFALDDIMDSNFIIRWTSERSCGPTTSEQQYSLNQADMVFERAPDTAARRPFGVRIDLQFGQATDTFARKSANEPRPQIYRIFFRLTDVCRSDRQRAGLDVGKWGSSIGSKETNTKDQINYSRALWFDFCRFQWACGRL